MCRSDRRVVVQKRLGNPEQNGTRAAAPPGSKMGVTEIVRSEDYESLVLPWLYSQVQSLRAALLEAGIGDEEAVQTVCETYLFRLAAELDAGTAVIAFERGDALVLPESDFELHDYAIGVIEEALDDA